MSRLDRIQRRLIRVAYHSSNGALRRRLLEIVKEPDPSPISPEISMTPFVRRLVRIAFETDSRVLRTGILETLKTAAYSKKFLHWAKGRKHYKPSTGNQVVWDSLTSQEQAAVYAKWYSQAQAQPSEGVSFAQVPPQLKKEVSPDRRRLLSA